MEINHIRTGYSYTKSTRQSNSVAGKEGAESFLSQMQDAAGAAKDRPESSMQTTDEMMQFIRGRKQEILEKVKKGETEVKIRIGAQEYTQKEWNKLIESFDESEDDIRKKLREAREQQRKASAERAGEEEEET